MRKQLDEAKRWVHVAPHPMELRVSNLRACLGCHQTSTMAAVLFTIDPSASEALFEQLAIQVRSAVARGELPAGTRLPSARELASLLSVNLHTVLRAYQDLRDEGLLELRRGRGAVITARAEQDYLPLREAIDHLVSVSRQLELAPGTTTALIKEALR